MSKLEQFEIKKYWQIFSGILKQNNTPKETKVSYDLVKPILFNSKLDSSILNKIWNLSDIDDDDCLDFEEFVICMRLLFDMVNKSIDKLPDQLPEWLIPGSKVDLLKNKLKEEKSSYGNDESERLPANNAAASESLPAQSVADTEETPFGDNSAEQYEPLNKESETQFAAEVSESKYVEKVPESKYVENVPESKYVEDVRPPIEWYMSPTEKSLYEAVYSTFSLKLDKTVSFESIYEGLKSKILVTNLNNITELDVSKVWHLLNPSNLQSINKDPALYLIHVIKQMNDKRCEPPTSIPSSLEQTFKQNEIDGNLLSSSNNINRTKIYSTPINKNSKKMTQGTDFSSIEGKDWEKIRLKQELEQLDKQYEEVTSETEKLLKASHLDIVREQFQQLLTYKQDLLINGKKSNADLAAFKDDLEIVEEQVANLESYLQQRTQVLKTIQAEL